MPVSTLAKAINFDKTHLPLAISLHTESPPSLDPTQLLHFTTGAQPLDPPLIFPLNLSLHCLCPNIFFIPNILHLP